MTWPKVKLGDVCEILSGFAFDSNCFNDKEGLPIVRIRDVTRGFSTTFYEGDFPERFLLSRGDILIGMDGEFNRAKWGEQKALLNQRVCKIDACGQLDRDYMFHFLPAALKEIEAVTPFVTVKHLSVKGIQNIEIPLPPIAEQKRLATILDRADELRRARRQSLRVLDELAQSLFLELFGDPATNPKGWEVVRLGEAARINPRLSKQLAPNDEVSFVPMACVLEEGRLEREETRNYSQVRAGFTAFQRGDVLFAKITPCFENGKIAIATIKSECGFGSTEFHVIRNVIDKTDNAFLLHFLRQKRIRTEGERSMTGSAGQRRVPKHFLEEIKIPLPPLSLQQQFAQQIEELEAIKMRARASLLELDALFASLQARAFAGELSGAH